MSSAAVIIAACRSQIWREKPDGVLHPPPWPEEDPMAHDLKCFFICNLLWLSKSWSLEYFAAAEIDKGLQNTIGSSFLNG